MEETRSERIFRNGIVGVSCQCISIIVSFISRSLFLNYIGEEMLGLNSTFSSVLEALSLSELGFQSAVVYMLYKPIQENDREKINDIVNLLKKLYQGVGLFFILCSVGALPALKYILKGIEINSEIYLFFLMQASISAISYFLAYPRSLLYADQKEYFTKLIDTGTAIFFNICSFVSIIYFQSYSLFLVFKIVNTVVCNLFIYKFYRKKYPYIHKSTCNKMLFKQIWINTKNIFVARIAGFLYRSTDNLVISSFINTITVAFYGNYMTILVNLRNLVDSAMNSMIPIIGNSLISAKSESEKKSFFYVYSHARYLIALVIVIPFLLLIDKFIIVWLGKKYVMNTAIKYLLATDLFIHLVHGPTQEFITAAGLFREERKVEIVGAFLNISLSIIGVKMLGLPGVLVGTVISQIAFWIQRSHLVFARCFNEQKEAYILYWIKELIYVVMFGMCLLLCKIILGILDLDGWGGFFVEGVLCELLILLFIIVVLQIIPENKELLSLFISKIRKKEE